MTEYLTFSLLPILLQLVGGPNWKRADVIDVCASALAGISKGQTPFETGTIKKIMYRKYAAKPKM